MSRSEFSFVVIADTHVNESDQTSTSPYETNHLANARARYVFQEVAAMDPPPAFVIHLGDIVHPVPGLPSFHDAVGHFKAIAEPLTVPLHVIPGNHDVGDKTIDWMPADKVCDDYLRIYREAFGADFYAFDHGNVRFVMLNSLLLNSGLADEERQRSWFEQQIDTAEGRRVYAFMHYPPFIYSADERGSYDNIDEPGRSWLTRQLARPEVEAIFAGHVHNFWYDRIGDAEMYMLPSTAFLRHDFSEFSKTDPGFEYGRGDVAKFGYFRVDVFADGHVAYAIRSMGRQSAIGEVPELRPSPPLAHPKTSGFDSVGVELRHPWAEVMQITATGGVQEFGRKQARNDYPLLAMWEMGLKLAKVPDVDVLDDETRSRMKLMSRLGQRYMVTVLGAPRDALLEAAIDSGVAAFEANMTLETFEQRRDDLARARTQSDAKVFLAKILTDSETRFDGATFSHFVKSGFTVSEVERHQVLIRAALAAGEIDGVTVRVDMEDSLADTASRLRAIHDETGCEMLVSLKLASGNPAAARTDDREIAARAAQAVILSRCGNGLYYVFDTFMDVDRGYFPRHAFIDRRFNPRPAAGVFTQFASLFPGTTAFALNSAAAGQLQFRHGQDAYHLACGRTHELSALLNELADDLQGWDLITGMNGQVTQLRKVLAEGTDQIHALLVKL